MKRFINKISLPGYIRLHIMPLILMLLSSILLFTSCDKDLDVRTDFSFEVSHMPVPGKVKNSETVEIRCKIEPKGNYADTKYTIRYFQYGGMGKLTLKDHAPLTSNDSFPLPDTNFNLYYTAVSGDSHQFNIWIQDNHGNEQMLSFDF